MPIKRIDHIAIVVEDIDAALNFWEDALGLEVSEIEEVKAQEAMVAFLPSGQSEVELVQPTNGASGIAKFLHKRGPGVHHICFEVDDIRETMNQLKLKGVQLINDEPTIGTGGKQIAFVHPKSTNGVLVELYELTPEEPQRRRRLIRNMQRRLARQGYAARAGLRQFIHSWRGQGARKEKASVADDLSRLN